MRKAVKITLIILIVLVGLIVCFAVLKRVTLLSWEHNQVNQSMSSNEAINGYDPVAYFLDREAVAGETSFTHSWRDAVWYFSSQNNKTLFIENPEKYAPQYGGYCAFAVSKGFTANSAPDAFELIEGKLYLFADEDMKSNWMENQQENLQKSQVNWED